MAKNGKAKVVQHIDSGDVVVAGRVFCEISHFAEKSAKMRGAELTRSRVLVRHLAHLKSSS